MPNILWNGNPASLQGRSGIADQDIRLPNDFRFLLNVVRHTFGVCFHVACSSESHHALMTVGMALKTRVRPGTQNENPTSLNIWRQSIAECIERNRLPGHERV